MKVAVFLGGGKSQQTYINALKHLEIYTIVVDQDKFAPARETSDKFINCSKFEGDRIADLLMKDMNTSQSYDLLVLSNSGGKTCNAIATIGKRIGFETYSHEAALCASSKLKFKKSFNRSFKTADYEINNKYDWLESNKKINWNRYQEKWPKGIFIKPDMSSKSKVGGVYGMKGFDLNDIIKHCQNNILVLEEYIPEGKDIVVPMLVRNGETVVKGRILEEINYVTSNIVGYGFKALEDFDSEIINVLYSLSDDYIHQLKINNAPVALTFRIEDKSITPVELHLDFGGENLYEFSLGLTSEELLNVFINALPHTIDPTFQYNVLLYDHYFNKLDVALESESIEYKVMWASSQRKQFHLNIDSTKLHNFIGQYHMNLN